MIKKLKREDIDLADWEFEFQQRGEQPISLCDFFCRSLDRHLFNEIGAAYQHCDYLFTDSDKGYNSRARKETVTKVLRKKMSSRTFTRMIMRNSLEIPRDFNTVADTLSKEVLNENISNETLAKYWREMDESFLKVIPWFFYPWYLSKENVLTDTVKRGLERYRAQVVELCDFDEALLAIVFPLKKTGFQLEQEEMLGLVSVAEADKNFQNNSEFQTKAKEYLRKYDWLTTFILTPLLPMTYEQLVERVRRAVNESFREVYALQKEATEKNIELAKRVIQLVVEDRDLLDDIADARELGYVLTAGIEEAYMASARYLPLMQLVAGRIGVTYEEMKLLMSVEVQNALKSNTLISRGVIEERKKGFVMMIKDGVQSACFGRTGHEISGWIDTELNKIDTTIKELKGQPACKGYAKGRVRVALQPSEAHQLEESEILVCPMTNPDYVPAMRRSGAIVTDEGGLLSHAAIMSREFNKPCVIATKIATQLLKTGDLVEVDADNGVVRILK